MSAARDAVLRTLAFHEAWNYAPTFPELMHTLDTHGAPLAPADARAAAERLIASRDLALVHGRLAFPERVAGLVASVEERGAFEMRKRRRARLVTRYLARAPGVRFVALANTTALGAARDESDLDFFVVVRRGAIWSARLVTAGPLRFTGLLPHDGHMRDAACLSYFVSDDGLELSAHMLRGDDPYYRFWFLSLLPLMDDGVSSELWQANRALRARHPFARSWRISPDLKISNGKFQIPNPKWMESAARRIQTAWFPDQIMQLMNRDSRVMVSDVALKFHVDDRREEFRATYRERCRGLGIEA